MTLADKLKNSINKRLERPVAKTMEGIQDLLQVDDWIEMPSFFQKAVGGKGFPCGHITQIVGESDTGKTTILMEAMVKTQKDKGLCFLIDSEHKFSFRRFTDMGGASEEVIVMSVDSLEEAWTALQAVVQEVTAIRETNPNVKILLAWDSIAASVPDALLDAESSDHHVSVEAKINNKEVRKARQAIKRSGIAAVFINHTYWSMPKFGIAKEILKGGAEMFYLSTLIIKTKRKGWLERDVDTLTQRYGAHSLLEVFKGHLGGEKTTTEFYVVGKGILDNKKALDEYKLSFKK